MSVVAIGPVVVLVVLVVGVFFVLPIFFSLARSGL